MTEWKVMKRREFEVVATFDRPVDGHTLMAFLAVDRVNKGLAAQYGEIK